MRSMMINPLFDMVRSMRDPFDVSWDEAIRQSMIPEDGSIITRTETVKKQYKVAHKENGTIELVPFEGEDKQ
jgi:hypothetical protein